MPIPENAAKELLSLGFLRLAAGQAGFVPSSDELDFGVDLTLRHVDFVEEHGRIGFRASGFAIDVQVKATCEDQIRIGGGSLKYDITAANYNDLVRRGREYRHIPLILVLFVLPDFRADWLVLADSELTLRRCGYVWRPHPSDKPTGNLATKRIAIPLSNRVDFSTFERLRQEYLS